MKTDVNLSLSMTVNMGNYSSIKPGVSMTLKDVDIDKVDQSYSALSKIISELFKIETANAIDEYNGIRNPNNFRDDVLNNIQGSIKILDDNLEILTNLQDK